MYVSKEGHSSAVSERYDPFFVALADNSDSARFEVKIGQPCARDLADPGTRIQQEEYDRVESTSGWDGGIDGGDDLLDLLIGENHHQAFGDLWHYESREGVVKSLPIEPITKSFEDPDFLADGERRKLPGLRGTVGMGSPADLALVELIDIALERLPVDMVQSETRTVVGGIL